MATEIYLQPELEEMVTEPDKKMEWETKIKELGLTGQIELTKNSQKDAASPYTFMNKQMKLVYETICPSKASVEKFNKSVIPIEILSHIALCKQEGYFRKLEIWYDDKSPDPVLVGYVNDSYDPTRHLIARWGDEIIPYEQLLEKAISRYTQGFKLSVSATKAQCEELLQNVELKVQQLFAGQKDTWSIEPKFSMNLTHTDTDLSF